MTATLPRGLAAIARAGERVLWGGRLRERVLVALLREHYASLMRRKWRESGEPPHFFDHRIGSFALAMGEGTPFGYYRGYFAAEVIRKGDTLLDIGCGDGFFARRFFRPKCERVDAIDVEPDAIAHARRLNAAPGVNYVVCDAVRDEFPSECYDVIVWDGGVGHLSSESTLRVLEKIRYALESDGVFVGSESLGREGHDHLQFFFSLEELASLFRLYFAHVQLRKIAYDLPGMVREEAFWRCAVNPARLEEAAWEKFDPRGRTAQQPS